MRDKWKIQLLRGGLGVIAIAIVVAVLTIYNNSKQPEHPEETLPEAEVALTEDEIESLYDTYRPNGEAEEDVDKEEEAAEEVIDIPVDFQALQELNPDVYAWISIPGAGIEYPVLQHEYDDSYYLNYNIDGSYGYPGCIYTESINNKDFQDNNTVLYGHNMKNGSMFGDLHKFENGTFFEENREVYIYTPEGILTYTIFAAYTYDDRHIMYSFDFTDENVYASYIEAIFERRSMSDNLDSSIEVTKDDKIITLATCVTNQPEQRYLVQAVLVEME